MLLELRSRLVSDPGKTSQLLTGWIDTLGNRFAIDQNQGKALRAFAVQNAFDERVAGKRRSLLRQVVPFDGNPFDLSQSRFAANCGSTGSTAGPQTPVEQHIAGSNTSSVFISPPDTIFA